jgi:type IV secretion system pilin
MIKSIAKSAIFIFLLMNLGLTVQMAFAAGDTSDPAICKDPAYATSPLCLIKSVGEHTTLPSFVETGQHPDAPENYINPGAATVTTPIYYAIDLFRFVMSGLAMIVIVIHAAQLIGRSTDEEATKAKSGLLYGIIGLLLVQLASVIVKQMFFGEYGEAFEDEYTIKEFGEESTSQIRGIIGFIEIFVGAAAVFTMVVRGMKLMYNFGDEEEMTKAKKHIGYAMLGLVIVGISELVINGFIFPDQGSSLPDVGKGNEIIKMLINYVSGFIAILSFIFLFYAGYRYVAFAYSEEESEKIKKIFIGAIIGLLLAFGAFAITNTLLDFDPTHGTDQVSLPDGYKEIIIT